MISTPRLTNGTRLGLAAVLVLGAFLAATNLPFARAATFLVDSQADTADLTPGDGTCEISTGGACTLRAAVEEANALAGADVIQVPAGTYTLGSVLPITSTISIAPVNTTDGVTITGAAIFQINTGGNLTLTRLTLTGASTAPAIDMLDGTLTMSASTISGNAAGAVSIVGGVADIQTTTISGNSGVGVAIVEAAGTSVVTLTHVTVSNNSSVASAGGVAAVGGADVTVSGSILANNTGASADCEGSITTSGANIIETPGAGCVTTGTAPTSVDPGLGALGNNGGPTSTQVPANTSAAIDAAGACSGTDQRGVSRARGSGCDLGAVELPVITFTQLSYTATDSNTSVGLLATIGSSVPFNFSVPYSLVNGSAVSGTDFSGTGGSFSFLAGVANSTSGVTILRRTAVTGDLAFSAAFGTTNAVAGNGPASIGITDVDPIVSWSSLTYTVGEAAGTLSVTASLGSVDPTDPVTVTFQTVENGTARQTVEYTPITSGTIVVPANSSSATGSVTILDNNWDANGDKTFTVRIVSTSRGTLGSPTDSTVTVTDNEGIPGGTLSSSTYAATEGVSPRIVTITLPYTSEQSIGVVYATANGAGQPGAFAGEDYTATSGTASFPSGTTSVNVNVPILNNGWYSGAQSFGFNLSSQTVGSLGATTSATINLTDDEAIPAASIGTPSPFSEGAGSVGIGATLPYTSEIAIDVGVVADNGSAVAGADFDLNSSTISFPVGTNSASISVNVRNNDYYSGQQSFQLRLTTQSIGTPNTTPQTVLINDNDTPPGVSLSSGTYSGSENSTAISVVLTVPYTSEVDISVPYTFVDGGAVVGRDHNAASGTAIFTGGASSVNLGVPVINNTYYSGSRSLTVQLGTQSPSGTGATTSATITITDDEGIPGAFVETPGSSGGYSFSEVAANAVVTVTLPYTSTSDINVSFSTQNGTATAGVDYSAVASSFNILAGQTSATVSIPIINNNVNTGDRYFSFSLISQSPPSLGAPTSAQITIIDAQQPPKVQFTLPSFNVARNIGTAPITVTLSAPSGLNVTVAYTMSNGTALSGVDYTSSSGTLTFTPGMTTTIIQVPILNSGLYVGDRIFNLGLSAPSQATLGDNAQATVLIRETNARRVYLAQIRKNYDAYNENEPNGTLANAKGPLLSGATYRGGYDASQIDQYKLDRDTWMFTVLTPGQVTVTVISNDTGRQVKLLNASGADIPGGFSGDPGASTTFTVNVTAAGTYYVRVFSSAQLGTQQYQLRVTHP